MRSRFIDENTPTLNQRPFHNVLPSFSELITSIPLPQEFKIHYDIFERSPAVPKNQENAHQNYSVIFTPSAYQGHVRVSGKEPDNIDGPRKRPISFFLETSPKSKKGTKPDKDQTSSITTPNSDIETPNEINKKVNVRKYVCKVCSRSFTTSGHLARHNRIHTGERKHVCPWPSCNARFARQDNCMQHYKTHRNGRKGK